jgi:Na+/melibiose symporter-like transporter
VKKEFYGKTLMDWVKDLNFYIHGMVYMLVRIAINVTMTVMPFYLDRVTGYEATKEKPTPVELAMVPLVSYITGLIFSIFLQ